MTIYNLGNIKGEKGDKGDSVTGPTGPVGVGIRSIEQITNMKFKFCLTDGSEYIINYGDEPTFDGISVSSTQDILSYADGDSTIVSAQLTNQGQAVSVSGESVTFEVRKQSDDSLVETLTDTTDSNGEASVEYFGKGVGDLYVKCQCRSVIEIYDIEDCVKYYGQTFSSTVNANLSLPNNCSIEFVLNSNGSTSNNSVFLKFDNASKYVGKMSSGNRAVLVYDGSNHELNTLPVSTDTTYIVEWVNNVCTFKCGTDSITFNMTNPTLLELINGTSNGTIKNIKIKPL